MFACRKQNTVHIADRDSALRKRFYPLWTTIPQGQLWNLGITATVLSDNGGETRGAEKVLLQNQLLLCMQRHVPTKHMHTKKTRCTLTSVHSVRTGATDHGGETQNLLCMQMHTWKICESKAQAMFAIACELKSSRIVSLTARASHHHHQPSKNSAAIAHLKPLHRRAWVQDACG